jgi:hypothetical protein
VLTGSGWHDRKKKKKLRQTGVVYRHTPYIHPNQVARAPLHLPAPRTTAVVVVTTIVIIIAIVIVIHHHYHY